MRLLQQLPLARASFPQLLQLQHPRHGSTGMPGMLAVKKGDGAGAASLVSCRRQRNFLAPAASVAAATGTAGGSQQQQQQQERLVLVDGNNVMYRAYYKLMARIHHGKLKEHKSDGNGDSVLTGFTALASLLRLLELLPSCVAVVFDFKGATFRHLLLPTYKAGRPPVPDALEEAVGYVKSALLAMDVPVLEIPGVEADDVIAALAVQAVAAGMKVRVASVDKDFFQLLSPSLRLLRPLPKGSGTVSFGVEEFKEMFGDLEPSQFVDVLALMGDSVDNIPGVPGIGEKTAVKLIREHGSLETLLERCEDVPGKRVRESLLSCKEAAALCKTLVTLRSELPETVLPSSLQDLAFRVPQDGGQKYIQLLDAMGTCVDPSECEQLKKRSLKLWESLQ